MIGTNNPDDLSEALQKFGKSNDVSYGEGKEKENKSFLLRMDSRMMNALEKWADDEFRSINGQILWILEQALKKSGRLKNKSNNSPSKK